MTDEQKAKLAQARKEAAAKKKAANMIKLTGDSIDNIELNRVYDTEPQQFKTEIQGEWVPQEIEHNGHTIIVEPEGRVVVAKHGLYVTEFDHIDKARDHIDGLNDA